MTAAWCGILLQLFSLGFGSGLTSNPLLITHWLLGLGMSTHQPQQHSADYEHLSFCQVLQDTSSYQWVYLTGSSVAGITPPSPCSMYVATVAARAGVPTVWLNLLQHVNKHNLKMRHLKRVCIAGSAPPRSMIEALEG